MNPLNEDGFEGYSVLDDEKKAKKRRRRVEPPTETDDASSLPDTGSNFYAALQQTCSSPRLLIRRVPTSFVDVDDYRKVFSGLVLEECKAEIAEALGDEGPTPLEVFCEHYEYATNRGAGQLRLRVALLAFDSPDERERVKASLAKRNGLSGVERDALSTLRQSVARKTTKATAVGAGDVLGFRDACNRPVTCVATSHARQKVVSTDLERNGLDAHVLVDVLELDLSALTSFTSNKTAKRGVVKLTNVLTQKREFESMYSPKISAQLMKHVLSGSPSKQTAKGFFECESKAFRTKFDSKFNVSQKKAIRRAAQTEVGVTLVQGPAGTGKTSTIVGLLNLLHLEAYFGWNHRHLPDETDLTTKRKKVNSSTHRKTKLPKALLTASIRGRANAGARTPHFVVTAPSNTAVDNALLSVLKRGFFDSNGQRYDPIVLRVGGGSNAVSSKLDAEDRSLLDKVSLNAQIDVYVDATRSSHESRKKKLEERIRERRRVLTSLNAQVQPLWERVVESPNRSCVKENYANVASRIVAAENEIREASSELERHEIMLKRSVTMREKRTRISDSLVSSAEIVFSTLSGCAGRWFSSVDPEAPSAFGENAVRRVQNFPICVVDEAAQCVEPSTLVPLRLGVRHLILVGDPKQLPATVASPRAIESFFQQSMFERLALHGHKVFLLDTQYRSIPLIADWPNSEFYQHKLLHGAKVVDESYGFDFSKIHDLRSKLVFFDVSKGIEVKTDRSYSNALEAKFVYNLYKALRSLSRTMSIGIITPYKQQLKVRRVCVCRVCRVCVLTPIYSSFVRCLRKKKVRIDS